MSVGLATESDDPITISRAASGLIQEIRSGTKYVRAGVTLTGLGGLKHAPEWTMKREMLSRRATTHWDELCEASA